METVGGQQVAVDGETKSLRATLYPNNTGLLGAYSLGVITGILPATPLSNAEIFQFRWTSNTKLAVIRRVKISAAVSTTFFAAGVPVQIEMRAARQWSADGTGGTAIVFSTSDTNKRRTRFPLSSLSDTGVRIATTAGLGAGTKTLDTNALAMLAAGGPVTGSLDGTIIHPGTVLWERDPDADYPLVLDINEGFIVKVVASPATGTWTVALSVDWQEELDF